MRKHLYLVSVAALAATAGMLMLALLLADPTSARAAPTATSRYVSAAAGTDTGECTYDAPCRTVQYALTQANPGDTLIIASGTYTGTLNVTRTTTLEGGYLRICLPNCTWLRLSCDPSLTVLDGLHAGRVVSVSSGVALTVNCLTIANGDATGLGGGYLGEDAGGGLYARYSGRVLISNAVISNNTASYTGYGGGIYADLTPLTLVNTQVISNYANFGGGVALDWANNSTIEGCEFTRNRSWGDAGGGLYIANSRNVQVTASSFSRNSAFSGGGLALNGVSSVVVTDSVFSNNNAVTAGGIYIYWSDAPSIRNCEIFSNTATQKGGGLMVYGRSIYTTNPVLISGNVITSNNAQQGGGVCISANNGTVLSRNQVSFNEADYGSGMYLKDSTTYLYNDFVFSNHATTNGGGVYVDGGTSRMAHNTLVVNSSGGWGSGVHVIQAATARLTNTILAGYSYNNVYASGIYVSAGATATLEATLWGTGTLSYKYDWAGDGTILTGTVNIWADPDFVNPCGNDYHIGPDSAAIGRGVDAGVPTDFDGETRVGAPDIGADEYVTYTYLPLTMKE